MFHLVHPNARSDSEMHERLSWYERVSNDLRPAKYRIARRIPCHINLDEASDETLWKEHTCLSELARALLNELDVKERDITTLPTAPVSF